jgi:hypothetical protein
MEPLEKEDGFCRHEAVRLRPLRTAVWVPIDPVGDRGAPAEFVPGAFLRRIGPATPAAAALDEAPDFRSVLSNNPLHRWRGSALVTIDTFHLLPAHHA